MKNRKRFIQLLIITCVLCSAVAAFIVNTYIDKDVVSVAADDSNDYVCSLLPSNAVVDYAQPSSQGALYADMTEHPSVKTYYIGSERDLEDVSIFSKENSTEGYSFTINSESAINLDDTFSGIGSKDNPFKGLLTFTYSNTNSIINLNGSTALFAYLDVCASVSKLDIRCNDSMGGLAQVLTISADAEGTYNNFTDISVSGNVNNRLNNRIFAENDTEDTGLSDGSLLFGSIESEADSDVMVDIGKCSVADNSEVSSAFGCAGGIAGRITTGTGTVKLKLYSESSTTLNDGYSINSDSASAGGIYGSIEGKTAIVVSSGLDIDSISQVSSVGGNAGIVAGEVISGSLSVTLSGNTAAGITLTGTGTEDIVKAIRYYNPSDTNNKPELTGNAGGVVGYISGTASFISGAVSVTNEIISAGTSSGGVFGYVDYQAGTTISTGAVSVNGGVIGNAYYDGCYIGRLDASKDIKIGGNDSIGDVSIGNVSSNAPKIVMQESNSLGLAANSVLNHGAGGLIGYVSLLANDGSSDLTIDYSGATVQSVATEISGSGNCIKGTAAGGLVGVYNSGSVKNTLLIKGKNDSTTVVGSALTTSSANSIFSYGGVVGLQLANSYCEVTDMSSTTSSTSAYSAGTEAMCIYSYGGIAGYVYDGAVLDVEDIKVDGVITPANCVKPSDSERQYSGGIAGYIGEGSVLRFIGNTTLGNNCYANTLNINDSNVPKEIGQLVGYQDNSLIYADHNTAGEDWSLTRCNNSSEIAYVLDDISNYGRVIRSDNDKLNGVISFDGTEHTITMNSSLSFVSGTPISLGTPADYAKLAVTLNSRGYISAVSGITSNNYANLLKTAVTISIAADINLQGTGIEVLTRCDSATDVFRGTLNGNQHTLTLAIGETYGTTGRFGNGEVAGHAYLGMFGYISGAAINNITIAGDITCAKFYNNTSTVQNSGAEYNNRTMYAGGIAGRANANISIDNVTTQINISEKNSTTNNKWRQDYYGGLIGYYVNDNVVYRMSISNSFGKANIIINNSHTKNSSISGGLVGVIEASGATVNVDIINTSMSGGSITTVSDNGSIASSIQAGGVVGYFNSKPAIPNASMINIQGLDVNGQTMSIAATSTTGGYIGYNWVNVNVVLSKYTKPDPGDTEVINTINGAVTNTGGANYGGLFYQVTGKLDVSDTTITGSFSGSAARANVSDGVLVCQGVNLYAIVNEPTVHILEGGSDSMKTGGASYDDLVGTNIVNPDKLAAEGGIAQFGGILSIEQVSDPISNAGDIDTPWETNHLNKNSRYYYNLNGIDKDHNTTILSEIKASDGTISSSEAFLLWHILNYVSYTDKTGWPNYYFNGSTEAEVREAHNYTVSSDIDMTNLSIYPTSINSDTSFDFGSKTVTFDFDGMNSKLIAVPTSGSAALNSQHYMMQAALFNNVTASLSVQNAALTGTAGISGIDTSSAASGALVMGTCSGTYDSENKRVTTNIEINNIILDDLFIDGITSDTGYAPLLLNKISTCVNLAVDDVDTQYNSSLVKAGTSLIGSVGSSTAAYLSVNFTGMVIEGLKTNAVLTKASLLDSFNYLNDGSSSGSYNFYIAEDWPEPGNSSNHLKHVTYGAELEDEETEYYDADISFKVNPVYYPASTSDVYDFNPNYLKYVASGNKLRVNIKSGDLDTGCGTYTDPYIITSEKQFMAVYNYINIGTSSLQSGWKVNYPKNNDSSTAGDNYMYCDGDDHDTLIKGTTADFDTKVSRKWISQAYYKITGALNLSSEDYTGLGTNICPFEGIIIGESCTITMPVMTSAGKIANMGLVNYAGGCVIKSVTVNYSGVNYLSNTKGSYFGGIIGNVVGGDNVIDNCYVAGISEASASNRLVVQSRLTYAGGYVGYLQSGGVIFRNMNEKPGAVIYNHATNTAETNKVQLSDSNYYYANPYVGRVLDGYAVAETGTALDNTNKNYSIATLSGTADSVKVDYLGTSGTDAQHVLVDVTSAEGLLVFSQALNCGALSTGLSSDAYAYGTYNSSLGITTKVRRAAYDRVGDDSIVNTDDEFKKAVSDDKNIDSSTNSYLLDRYFLCDSKNLSATKVKANCITLAYYRASFLISDNCNMTNYKNGFRGLGGRYITDTVKNVNWDRNKLFYMDRTDVMIGGTKTSFYAFDGNNKTVSYDMDVKQYSDDAKLAVNFGLINTANHKNRLNTGQTRNQFGSTFKDVTVSGALAVGYYNSNGVLTDYTGKSYSYAGGLTAAFEQDQNSSNALAASYFSGIKVQDLDINAPSSIVGGAIGNVTCEASMEFANCWHKNLSVNSNRDMGGIIGKCTSDGTNSSDYHIDFTYDKNTYISQGSTFVKNSAASSCGGIVGITSGSDIEFNVDGTGTGNVNCKNDGLTITQTIQGAADSNSGGIAGSTAYTTNISDTDLSNSTIQADQYSKRNNYTKGNAGGYIGNISNTLVMNNCSVIASDSKVTSIYGGNYAAGLVANSTAGVTISNCNINTAGTTGRVRIEGNYRAAGLMTNNNKSGVEVKLDNNNIGNAVTDTIIYAFGQNAGGMIANVDNSASIKINTEAGSGSSITNCRISSYIGSDAGVIGVTYTNSTAVINNISLTYCDFTSGAGDKHVGGIIGDANGDVFLNNITLRNNRFIAYSNNNTYYPCAGTIASVAVKGAFGNNILLDNNTYGRCTGELRNSTYMAGDEDLTTEQLKELDTASPTAKSGVWLYEVKSTASINLTALNINSTTKPIYSPWATGTPAASVLVYTDYDNEATTGSDVATNPGRNWAVDTAADPDEDITWYGNAVKDGMPGIAQKIYNANNDSDRKYDLYNNTMQYLNVNASAPNIVTLGKYTDSYNTTVSSMPILYLNGDPDGVLSEYADMLTNGGFTKAKNNGCISIDANEYTVQTDKVVKAVSETGETAGSVEYDTNTSKFISAQNYDKLSSEGGHFTVLTVRFWNYSAVYTRKNTMSIEIPVYFPQILEVQSHIRVEDHEEYYVRQFTGLNGSRSANVSKGGTFTAYVEYDFNELSRYDDWNYDKYISVTNIDGSAPLNLPKNTVVTMINLNTALADDYKAYYYKVLDDNTNELLLKDFKTSDDTGFNAAQMKNLPLLESCGNLFSNTEGVNTDNYSIERYVMVFELPANDSGIADSQIYHMNASIDYTEGVSHNVTLTEDKTDRSFVTVWKQPETDIDIAGSSTVISNESAVVASTDISVDFPAGYCFAMTNAGMQNQKYGVLRYYITDTTNANTIPLPVGTKITVNGSTSTINASSEYYEYIINGDDGNPKNILSDAVSSNKYEYDNNFSMDFSSVSQSIMSQIFATNNNYNLHCDMYITSDAAHIASGQQCLGQTPLVLSAAIRSGSVLYVSVDADSLLHLGNNPRDTMDETNDGVIDFRGQLDMSQCESSVISNIVGNDIEFELSLYKKIKTAGEGGTETSQYQMADIEQYISDIELHNANNNAAASVMYELSDADGLSGNGAAINANKLTGTFSAENISAKYFDGTSSILLPFTIKTKAPAVLGDYANYKLELKLTNALNETAALTDCRDHFIYTIANIYTDFIDIEE